MILDVGCGTFPRGEINVDVSVTNSHTDIVCDGNYLPFQDACFDKVLSYHTIEHTSTPFKFLKELVRVSKKHVTLRCPHRFSSSAKIKAHMSYFNKTWFQKACKLLGAYLFIDMTYQLFRTSFMYIPFFVRPRELVVDIYKNQR